MDDADIKKANEYWTEKEKEVRRIAVENGLDAMLEEKVRKTDFSSFLFELYDCGEKEASEVEILEAILELIEK